MSDDDRDPDFASAVTVDKPDGAPRRTGYRVPTSPPASSQRYEVGPELARGGLGRVATALDRTLQRRVAIKELHVRTEQGRRRFVREALTTARLQHPAIVPVLDAGAWDSGDPYLVLKLLEGKTLAEELATRPTTEARLALVPSLLAIADALGYAHEQGVVHRDVKPANIMVGTHGETVLLDWGIAHDVSASALETEGLGRGPEPTLAESSTPLTQVGAIAGTVRFMSPEQARGEAVTPAFDVYSLGATIASVLAGQPPFAELAADAVLAKLRAGATAIPALPDEVPADLAAIVAKATAPAAARYAHAGQLAEDLRKMIAGQLVSARRYTRRELLARWLRRHRWSVATAAAALVAIAVTAAIAVSSVVGERNVAVAQRAQAIARERELILAQARSSLPSDPTATIAWLKSYPSDAPHQDEVLALVDEAAGRGVARHVWSGTGAPADVEFMNDALVAAYRDGRIIRTQLATGAEDVLAKIDQELLLVRPHGDAVYALDQDGNVLRWSPAGLERNVKVDFTPRPTGLYFANELSELKLTFVDDWAKLIPIGPGKRVEPDPATIGDFAYSDDENDARAVYAVLDTGELDRLDPAPANLWRFAPHTWVRSSDDGKRYLAVEPSAAGVKLWVGSAGGGPPFELATSRACTPGEDQEDLAEISNDGGAVVVMRCGVVSAYATRTRAALPIESPDRVHYFALSPRGRWLLLGRNDGIEVIEVETSRMLRLASGSAVTQGGFSDDERWLYTVGEEQGLRAWRIDDPPTAVRLGDVRTPVRIELTTGGDVAVQRHLTCETWHPPEAELSRRTVVTASELRAPDDELMMWAWSGSDDGRTCVFAGRGGSALVRGAATLTLDDPHGFDQCVLTDDTQLSCVTEASTLVTLDVATGARVAQRPAHGFVHRIARFRGKPIALIQREDSCDVETFAGDVLVTRPGARDCRDLSVTSASHHGRESGLVIERTGGVDVWSDAGVLMVPSATGEIDVSRDRGLAAVTRDQAVEIWDLHTGKRRAGPRPHGRGVELLGWSPQGVLASSDDEIVQLWDPESDRTRVLYAPHVTAMVWSLDGRTLFTSDGRHVTASPIDLSRGASPAEVRARIEQLTTARIVDGRPVTSP